MYLQQGTVIAVSATVLINGKPAARCGDTALTCPQRHHSHHRGRAGRLTLCKPVCILPEAIDDYWTLYKRSTLLAHSLGIAFHGTTAPTGGTFTIDMTKNGKGGAGGANSTATNMGEGADGVAGNCWDFMKKTPCGM